jgi:minor extracellular serine protease Vpr
MLMRHVLVLLALGFTAFSQTRSRLAEYAVVLEDAPVARKIHSRLALRSKEADTEARNIRAAQAGVIPELQRLGATVTGATQVLVNAVIVAATRDTAAKLSHVAGVKYVTPVGKARPALDRAINLMNVPAAWSAVGGAAQAGAGIKIGIIDSGIDQNHPGFQDSSLQAPSGFPKGDAAYTNSKVIVARSYVQQDLAPGYFFDPAQPDPATTSQPDDYSPRDRMGHGTAIAMIAAGAQNTGPAATIQGVAPKAFLGNYKVYGSPGVNDFTNFPAIHDALVDAMADGMDVVTLSMTEGDPSTYDGPLDNLPECGGACDVYSAAVESAVAGGMVVVVSAGNDGNVGSRQPTLNTIHRPGDAPSAITVGALTNSHELYQAVRVNGSNIRALFGDGPQPQRAISGPIRDVASLGNDGLACSALPAGSLAGAIALVQRGTCFFSDKINNAQNAGAIAVVIYQSSGLDAINGVLTGANDTGIPAAMIGNTDSAALKASLASGANSTATLDPAFTAAESAPNIVWAASSHGPSLGDFARTPTNVVKPEIAAIAVNIYTAAQKLDPNGDAYNATGYTTVTGTSYAVPMIAGAVALVKQKHPNYTPAQLKSAVVNTATQDVSEAGATARVNAVGAGKLSAVDAVNAGATLEPPTISFGEVAAAALPISRTLRITNTGTASATFSLAVQQRDVDSNATLTVTPASITIGPGQQNSVTVRLAGTRPRAGSYEGFVVVTGSGPTLRLPYLYMVGSGVPADVFPIHNGFFIGGVGDIDWRTVLRVVDTSGVPVVGVPVLFNVSQGGGKIGFGDAQSFLLGNSAASLNLGGAGPQVVTATVQGFPSPLTFEGFARPYPTISANGIVDAATSQLGQGLAAGSYISLYGSDLSDALQVESTPYLPVSLSDVSVSLDADGMSQPGHLHFVSPKQVNVQIPWEFQGKSSIKVKVTISGLQGPVVTAPLAKYSPGMFEIAGLAAAEDINFAVITRAHPAKRGDVVQLFVNGLGPVTNTPPSGEPSAALPLSTTLVPPSVTIGGKAATVIFSGLTPGVVGLYQINAIVAADTPAGDQPIVVSIGGVDSKASVLPVQ